MTLASIDLAFWLPVVFAGLMGLAILVYVILDGYDLGVGILLPAASKEEKDLMIASVGPFWDANETWLVLAVGLLLVAFPVAHGVILTALYLPVAIMLLGLILRGVSFEFRVKAPMLHRRWWDRAFFLGSLTAALSQGYMLGLYIVGLETTPAHVAFGALTAVCLAAAYAFNGAAWLILKTEDLLQHRAVGWARMTLGLGLVGMIAVSAATPLVSPRIFEKWFAWPAVLFLAPVPLLTGAIFVGLWRLLADMPRPGDGQAALPFIGAALICLLGFAGMAYSFYPFVVPDQLTVWQAASAPDSLLLILCGAVVVLPLILAYTIYSYVVFGGKATHLSYD